MRTVLLWLFLSAVSYAKPPACQVLPIQGEALLIKTENPMILLVKNVSEHTLWLTHPLQDISASAGFTSQLASKKWSALFLEKGPFLIHCIESQPGHEQQIPCEGNLTACVYAGKEALSGQQGVFWVSENRSLSAIKTALEFVKK
jgi:hypothetical protein